MNETTNAINWDALRAVPPDSRPGYPRANCATCGLALWSAGGYKVPGLAGYYCSLPCAEQELFGTKKATAQPGERLMTYLQSNYPRLFGAVTGEEPHAMSGQVGKLFAGMEG